MRLGLHYWTFSTPAETAAIGPTLAGAARIADDGGVASFTVMDHYFQMEPTGPCGPADAGGVHHARLCRGVDLGA